MSRKTPAPPRKATSRRIDRRVRRTRDLLGDALVDLMHEKPFAAITVQQVINRADVGRSTFYTHYRDKDDLYQVAKSRWLRIQSVNRVFALTLTFDQAQQIANSTEDLLHKARNLPKEDFRQEVEKELTGKEEELSELIYFKASKSTRADSCHRAGNRDGSVVTGHRQITRLLPGDDLRRLPGGSVPGQ